MHRVGPKYCWTIKVSSVILIQIMQHLLYFNASVYLQYTTKTSQSLAKKEHLVKASSPLL